MNQLLATKLFVPAIRTALVSRPRLTARLSAGMGGRLTLICAPAGSGKTTLLTEFVSALDRPVAWISLDASDNDSTTFLTYMIAAFQNVASDVGASAKTLLESPQPAPPEQILTLLLNDLAGSGASLVVILDDYHVIESDGVHGAVAFLLRNLPVSGHVILSTRTTPPLGLARLRARRELNELGPEDLRFNLDESTSFFQSVMDLSLSPDVIKRLDLTTEGWITGMQLAALSIGKRGGQSEAALDFSGRDTYLLDYLVEEVIGLQTPEIQSFLLRTSILNRMSAPLCDAVTGRRDGQTKLVDLERANLFVSPLDNERRWYRYHHLFADCLRARLVESSPGSVVSDLHRRAGDWFKENALLPEAIDHYLSAGEYARAAALIEGIADELYSRGAIARLQHWTAMLPDEVIRTRPRTAIYRAWVLFFLGEGREDGSLAYGLAESYLEDAERTLIEDLEAAEIGETDELLGIVFAIRATIASARGRVPDTIRHGSRALDLLPQENHRWRCVVNIGLGFAHAGDGATAPAMDAFAEACRLGRLGGNLSGALFAHGCLASQLILAGHLRKAEVVLHQGLEVARESGGEMFPMTAQIHYGLGGLMFEWNRLDEAASSLKDAIRLSESGGGAATPDVLLLLARVELARRNEDEARALARRARRALDRRAGHHRHMALARMQDARFRLDSGDVEGALKWALSTGFDPATPPEFSRQAEYLALTSVLSAAGRAGEVLGVLDELKDEAATRGRTGNLIHILAAEAAAASSAGEQSRALEALKSALDLGQSEAFIQAFVEGGQDITELVEELLRSQRRRGGPVPGISRAYIESVLRAIRRSTSDLAPEPDADFHFVESFSDREIEILMLISQGLSNRQIADTLFVAVSTVKWHVNNIFGKLGVRSRTQALVRARKLGVLR